LSFLFNRFLKTFLLTFCGLLAGFHLSAQHFHSLRGYVFSTDNEPLQNASVRVFNLQTGTQTNVFGQYELNLEKGYHRLSVSFLGYLPQTIELVIDSNTVYNFFLEPDETLLSEVVVSSLKKDYSYEIIRNVIENKSQWQNQYQNMASQTYVKAIEEIQRTKPSKKDEENRNPFLADSLPDMTFFEARIHRYFAVPNHFKEERTAVKKLGDIRNLYYTSTTDGQFDLYRNLQVIKKLGENALISPFSTVGFIGYKFKLLETYHNGERLVFRIQIKPKELGNALYEGEVEVLDGIWAIHKVKLSVPKKLLLIYNSFDFEQEYGLVNGKRVITQERFNWKLKEGATVKTGESEIFHSDFVFDSAYSRNFFGLEIGRTTENAYQRDSSYWENIRPKPLSSTERAVVKAKELEEIRLNSKEYLDSVDAVNNKITFLKVIWAGVGHIDRAKKVNWEFGSLPSLLNPVAIGGWRINYSLDYLKRFENRKQILLKPYLNYGFLNRDLQGSLTADILYNPIRRSSLRLYFGKSFDVINGNATLGDILRRNNFYINTGAIISHRTELFNGFYFNSELAWNKREDLGNFKFSRLGNELFEQNEPARFPTTHLIKSNFRIDYTPGQQYLREPKEKIILGSRYPTFSLRSNFGFATENGVKKAFNYSEFNISHYFNVSIFGTSEYRIAIGKFMDTTRLAPMDYQYQRGGDPIWFSPSMLTYQLIPRTFTVFDWFFESHYEHQFNGFLTSKIPLINKTGISTVVGAGLLYVPEKAYQYSELYGGVNRIFRLGKVRLRLGAYYVVSQSNKDGFRSGFKFSLEPYNRDKNTWSF
jgi:hypothetical protein